MARTSFLPNSQHTEAPTLYHGSIVYLNESGQRVNKNGDIYNVEERGIIPTWERGEVFLTPEIWEALYYVNPRAHIPKSGITPSEAAVYEIKPRGVPREALSEIVGGSLRVWKIGAEIPIEWITGKYTIADVKHVENAVSNRLPLEEIQGLVYHPL